MKDLLHVTTQNPDFRRLFGGSTVSMLGSSVTVVALPLTAVSYLHASPMQMGLLSFGALLPNLLFSLPAGVWLTRLALRPVLVASDLLQAVVVASVPLLALLGLLHMWQLYLIVLLTGTCSLFQAIASESLLPALLLRKDLLAANGARAVSASVTTTSGAALGGAAVQLLTAPLALVLDALSFLVSAWWKSRIAMGGRSKESPLSSRTPWSEQVGTGFRVIFGEPTIRSITLAAMIGALAGQMQSVVLVLYFVRELGLAEATVGFVIAVVGAAGIAGGLISTTVTTRLGNGPTFIAGMLLTSASGFVLAAASGPFPLILILVVLGQVLSGGGSTLYGLNQQTIRQTLIPTALLSRALATWRVLVYGVQPVGALAGGVLGGHIGLRSTLIVSGALMLVGTATSFFGPLRNLRIPRSNDPG